MKAAGDPVGRLLDLVMDCNDLPRMAQFWVSMWGTAIAHRGLPYWNLDPLPVGLTVGFQLVPEPRRGKNRLHLDLTVPDLETARARALSLGANQIGEVREGGGHWWRMLGPEGNEFCLIPTAGPAQPG